MVNAALAFRVCVATDEPVRHGKMTLRQDKEMMAWFCVRGGSQ